MIKNSSAARHLAFTAALSASLASSFAAAWAKETVPVDVVNPVTVANPADPAAFAKAPNAIQHPFLLTQTCRFDDTVDCSAAFNFHTTNPNQAVVIDDASGFCTTATAAQLVDVEVDVGKGTLFLPITDHSGVEGKITFGQDVHLSLAANTTVELTAEINDFTLGIQCFLSVSGEAIDQ
jgi:hypothetical protein